MNRWNIKNHDLKIGDFVRVESVRSNVLDPENGIGWRAFNVIAKVVKVMDMSFCFEFNGEIHYALKNDVEIKTYRQTLFPETSKVIYEKDSSAFRFKYLIN